jgi:Domain of unknown function (DUF3806)
MSEPQLVEDLQDEDAARLDAQRAWVLDHYENRKAADSVEGKLRLLHTILENKWIEPHETWKLQSLGVILGDAFAQEFNLAWKMVSDNHGRDPALIVPDTTIKLFPLTMISKRVEDGRDVDVVELFGAVCGHVKAVSHNPEATVRESEQP